MPDQPYSSLYSLNLSYQTSSTCVSKHTGDNIAAFPKGRPTWPEKYPLNLIRIMPA
jgi:hypothetical protein